MATIDLGKLGFVNKGTYNNSTTYEKNDLVQFTDSGILSTYLYIDSTAQSGQAPSSSGTAGSRWVYYAKGGPAGADGTDVAAVLNNNEIAFKTNAGALDGLAIGSAGQFLKVNSGANGYEYGAVSSDFVKISTATASNVATFELDNIFSASDGYDSYQIVLNRLRPAVDNKELYMRFINSSGSIVTASDYIWGLFGQEANQSSSTNASQIGASASVSSMRIGSQGGGVSDNTNHGGMRMVMDIINPTKTGYTIQQHQTTYMRSGLDNIMNIMGGGVLQQTSNCRGISFYFNSGNVADGSVSVYGRKA
jgi:hypothetical protein